MNLKHIKYQEDLRFKVLLATTVIAGILIGICSIVPYWYATQSIRRGVRRHIETELQVKNLQIQEMITGVETAINNSVWAVEHRLHEPDSIYSILEGLVNQNKWFVGATASFEPNYFPQYGRWCELYVKRYPDGHLEKMQLGSAEHDYLKSSWYLDGMAAGKGHWSEPYYDDFGAGTMLCTYSIPVHDAHGRKVCLLDADISIEWLSELVNANPIYPSSHHIILSRTGKIIVAPIDSLVMKTIVNDISRHDGESTFYQVAQNMLKKESGFMSFTDLDGKEQYTFYEPVDDDTGWLIAHIFSEKDIVTKIWLTTATFSVLLLISLLLLCFLIWRTIVSMKRLKATQEQKASIQSELKIARNIQMSLLPKAFPAYPNRDDVDISASVVPAKEVGGDLYDFYIRDEKLFFCIGDVSGKGVPASLVMAITHTMFRNVSAHESRPYLIVSAMNTTLAEDNTDAADLFVTLFVGVLDLPTGRLQFCNAGHNAPYICGETIQMLDVVPNLPAGAIADWQFEQQEIMLDAQATIFLYTDGLSEAMNPRHELFGKQRIQQVLEQNTKPTDIIKSMFDAVHQFTNGEIQNDDITMLAIHYTKPQRVFTLNRSLTLTNDIENIPQLNRFISDVCSTLRLHYSISKKILLAVEEIVVNVIDYAYPRGKTGNIYIEAAANDERLKVTIIDNGKFFDPTEQPEVNTSVPGEQRAIGGLGIHLVRKFMDSINYNRVDGKNILTLRKKIK